MTGKKELGIGVIGAGGRGLLAAYAHKPGEGSRIVGGVDITDEGLKLVKEKYGEDALATRDYRELLAQLELDAVFVTSPDFLHEEHAVAALEAGKAVYLEKPMAITIEGCDRILEAAYRNKVKLYLGHNMRHFPVVEKMRELILQGAIGEVQAVWCRHFVSYGGDAYFKDWHADRRRVTSLLLQKGAHDLDVMHWLCNGYVSRVIGLGGLTVYNRISDRHAPSERGDATFTSSNWPPLSQKGMNPVMDVEDLSMVLMQYNNGVFASYEQCHYTPDGWRNYTVIGTEGRLENFGDVPPEAIVRLWNKRSDSFQPEGDVEFRFTDVTGSHGGADPKIVAEFVQYLREGGPIATSPIAARYAVAAGCIGAESLRNGNIPLDVPPVPDEIRNYFEAEVRGKVR